jgi:hypothetical protein
MLLAYMALSWVLRFSTSKVLLLAYAAAAAGAAADGAVVKTSCDE